MRGTISKLILVLIVVSIFSCCQDLQIPSFHFNPICVSDDVIFMRGRIKWQRVLFAVDTSSNKIIQKYKFDENGVNTFVYSSEISDKVVVLLDYEHYFFVLNPVTGKVEHYHVDYRIADLILAGNKVIINKNTIAYKGLAVRCKCYNLLTDKLEDFVVPEGIIGSRIDQNMVLNNKFYLPVYYDNAGNAGNRYPTIYNITDNKLIDFYPERNYAFFHFVGLKYMFAYQKQLYFDDEFYVADIYKVKSFEPIQAQLIISYEVSDKEAIGIRIFEDNDYLYVIDQPRDCQRITKRNKSDYGIVKQKVITENYEGGVAAYFKNDHFWITSREDEGAYKISKDLEITVVK